MWMNQYKRILALSPHTDDIEFACGATVAKFVSAGVQVMSVAFSAAEESVPDGLPTDILRREFGDAHEVLGVPEQDRNILDFKVRYFPRDRQEILEQMIRLNKTYKPDLVLAPSGDDTHQDHKTISDEAFRAFKRTTIWAYEAPCNQQVSRINCLVRISEEEILVKLNAIAKYVSQKSRPYVSDEFVHSLARVRGAQMGSKLAEGFEIVRQVQS
jgi:N-acetylglucosamine malate deacetylase 1